MFFQIKRISAFKKLCFSHVSFMSLACFMSCVASICCWNPQSAVLPCTTVRSITKNYQSASSNSDFERALPVTSPDSSLVNPDVYNVPLEIAAELWTVSVSRERSNIRDAGIPFLDSRSSEYFVDDVEVVLVRDEEGGSLGMELVELAGGRSDGYGLTIIEGVTGRAKAAGIIPGDSLANVRISSSMTMEDGISVEESTQTFECECRDFDSTVNVLRSIPPEAMSLRMGIKRIRRWPRVDVVVQYPPTQCAEGVDNTETLRLYAGENLRRGLLNRGVIMEDRDGRKCDFCGGKCTVSVDVGMQLLNPMGTTEEKIMKRNPKCRISCKTVVGYNMQEGTVRLRVNLNEWNPSDRLKSSPFAS